MKSLEEYKRENQELKNKLAQVKANYKLMVWTVFILTVLNLIKIIINI